MQTNQKKVVKVCYNGDMKRLKMTGLKVGQDYASLVEQTHKAFGKGSLPAEFKFYYMDEDNEMISINSQADLEEALSIEDFGALKLTVAGSTKEGQAQLCQKISDTQSMRESLNQSGFFAAPVQSPFGRGIPGLELQSMPSTDQLLTERAPIMRSAFQDDFENIDTSDKVVSAKIVEPVEEKKAEAPTAVADQELPKCARKGCNLRKHTTQKHGWCCGACRNKGKHGGGCEKVKFVGNGEAESSESEDEQADKNNGGEPIEQEEIECWKCFGKKINKKGKDCKKCEGTGVMRSNILAKVVSVVRSEVREYCDSSFQGLLSEYIVNKRQEQDKVEHEGYECDGCEVAPIKGIRYKCSVCPDYDLCETCEAKGTHAEHPMLKVRQPSHAPAQLLCQYKNIPSSVIPPQVVPQQQAQEEPKPRGFGTKKVEKSFVKYSGRFVKESFGDNHKVAPGQKITKSWTFRNDGQTTWPEDTLFIQTNGDEMKAQPVPINQVVAADSEHVWEVQLTAPEKEGRYQCFFRMVTGNNYRFGHKVWAELLVEKVAVEEKPKAVVCDFIAEAVKDIKDSIQKEQEAVFKPEVQVIDASVYPVIEVESTDKEGGESPLNASIKASGLMTPKEIYNKKAEAIESIVTRQGLTDLFELGFVNFEVNKSMLAKYCNDTQVVAGYLCEGILSESCINEVFNQ